MSFDWDYFDGFINFIVGCVFITALVVLFKIGSNFKRAATVDKLEQTLRL